MEITIFTCFECVFFLKTVFSNEVTYRLTANLCLKHSVRDVSILIFREEYEAQQDEVIWWKSLKSAMTNENLHENCDILIFWYAIH